MEKYRGDLLDDSKLDQSILEKSKKRRESIKAKKLELEKIKKAYGDDYLPPSEVKRKHSVDFWSSRQNKSWIVSLFHTFKMIAGKLKIIGSSLSERMSIC